MKKPPLIFYLWKDKASTAEKTLLYITDYNEKNSEGKVWIDGYGFKDVELVFSSVRKMDCITKAQTIK
jgi:hypothetical protein